MVTAASIRSIAARLAGELRTAYEPNVDNYLTGGQPLRHAFTTFGQEAALAGICLEDAMAVAVEALQDLFERVGGQTSDPATMLSAGIAMAAVSRAFHLADAERAAQRSLPTMPTQVARLAALHRINRAATANLKLTEMLETTVRVVAEATGSDACAVYLYDAATDSLALRAAVGLNASAVGAVTFRPGSGVTGLAAAEGRVIAAPDAHAHPAFVSSPVIGDDVYQSQISVPMLVQGANRLVGVLNILAIERRDFDDDEIAFLETVAGELAISIENARLYSRTDARLRRKLAELGTLQRVSRTLASTLDLDGVLRLIAEQSVELIQAELGAIFRLPRPANGSAADADPIIEYRVGEGKQLVDEDAGNRLVRQVVHSGVPLVDELAYVDGVRKVHCRPLRSARGTLGALWLRLRPGTEMTEDELGLLQAFSDSASLAIENAQLYQEARHGFETTSALLQEMHHRVRNNLQTVAALLSVQLRFAGDAPSSVYLREAVSRVQAIAAVHDLLSDERRLGGTTIDIIARHVADEAHSTLIPPGLRVEFRIARSDVEVPSKQATVLALLINELVSNAVSHGFKDRDRGTIAVRSWREDGLINVEVANDGHSVPAGFDPATSAGLGMRIVQRLVTSDLRGRFSLRSDAAGTAATITFPLVEGSGWQI